jgi:hypothetical protein
MMEDQDDKAELPTHTPGTRQGENIAGQDGKESGRHDTGTTHANRPSGGSTARDSTAINPDNVESDSDMPNMPPA